METKVRDWYVNAYPTDEEGNRMNKDITFDDVLFALENDWSLPKLFGVADSIIRERVFAKLAELMGKPYQYVYDLWLGI